jgi:large subunit ribosomal protein L25
MLLKTLKLKERQSIGKEDSKRLRRQGFIPCTLYGGNQGVRHLYGFVKDFRDVCFTPDVYKLNLLIEEEAPQEAIIQESQFHPLSDDVLHLDFLRVHEDAQVKLTLPVSFEGTPAGVVNGGRLFKKIRNLQVKGRVADIPEQLTIDVSGMDNGTIIKVQDLSFDNLRIMNNNSVAVASVALPKKARKAASS